MSAGSRLIMAVISLVCAAGFFLTALQADGVTANPAAFYGMAMFCVVVAIASLSTQSHPMTLRMIGAMLTCSTLGAFVSGVQTHHLTQAIAALLVFGLPAGRLAMTGKYPRWALWSRLFRS